MENSKGKEEDYMLLMLFMSFPLSIVFIVLVWDIVPINGFVKDFFLGVFGFIGVIFAILAFWIHLRLFKGFSSPWVSMIATVLVFFLFPSALHAAHDLRQKDFLITYPSDDMITARIDCDIVQTGSSGSIGGEWTFEHYFNGQRFKDGDTITINISAPFFIKSWFIENDGIDDIGQANSAKYTFVTYDKYKSPFTITNHVHVVETGGRHNKGSTADFDAVYKFTRVIPETMDFWDMLFFEQDSGMYTLCLLLTVGQVASMVIAVLVPVFGAKRMKLAKETETEQQL